MSFNENRRYYNYIVIVSIDDMITYVYGVKDFGKAYDIWSKYMDHDIYSIKIIDLKHIGNVVHIDKSTDLLYDYTTF